MFSTLVTVALFASAAVQGALAAFAVNTPDFKQCGTSKISWAPSSGEYSVIIVPAANPCGDAIAEVGDFKDKTTTDWKVAIPAGTEVIVSVVDSDDNEAWSNKITVGASDDTSCLKVAAATPPPSGGSTPPAGSSTDGGDGTPAPIGAANAGTNPFKTGAATRSQTATPLLALAGLAALAALL